MSQITSVDVTVPFRDPFASHANVASHLIEWAKKWAFQKEKSQQTGYVHWQIRCRLIKKVRLKTLISLKKFFPNCHVSPTSTTVHKAGKFNYVLKCQTRLEGPWTDTDYEPEVPLTRQLKAFQTIIDTQGFRPWQTKLIAKLSLREDRFITLIYDQVGNVGKSIFSEYLERRQDVKAFELPPVNNIEDIMAICMCIKPQDVYLVDMPRAMKKDKLGQFYAGLECLKNGYMYDKRYSFKRRRIDRPQIWVFTNTLPSWDLMSIDRWKVYELTTSYDLVDYDMFPALPEDILLIN